MLEADADEPGSDFLLDSIMEVDAGLSWEEEKNNINILHEAYIVLKLADILNVKRYFVPTVTYDLFHPSFAVDEWMFLREVRQYPNLYVPLIKMTTIYMDAFFRLQHSKQIWLGWMYVND